MSVLFCARADLILSLSQDAQAQLSNDPLRRWPIANADGLVTTFTTPLAEITTASVYKAGVAVTTGWALSSGTGTDGRDQIIFTENDYTLGLRNGSLGKIIEALPVEETDDPCCRCDFDGTEYLFNSSQIEALRHAYSITIHKSQGSQFKRVIVPIRTSRLLDQTLIYTAVTRSIEQVVLVGDLDAANEAVRAPATAARRHVALAKVLVETGRNLTIQDLDGNDCGENMKA